MCAEHFWSNRASRQKCRRCPISALNSYNLTGPGSPVLPRVALALPPLGSLTPPADIIAALRNLLLAQRAHRRRVHVAGHSMQQSALAQMEPSSFAKASLPFTCTSHPSAAPPRCTVANPRSVTLFIGSTAQLTGKLPYSRMKSWGSRWLRRRRFLACSTSIRISFRQYCWPFPPSVSA